MEEFKCRQLVFSSSATVYGAADKMPITEDTTIGIGITNAYGRTKFMIEEILGDYYNSTLENGKSSWAITILRYFNPVGAHPSGKFYFLILNVKVEKNKSLLTSNFVTFKG